MKNLYISHWAWPYWAQGLDPTQYLVDLGNLGEGLGRLRHLRWRTPAVAESAAALPSQQESSARTLVVSWTQESLQGTAAVGYFLNVMDED